MKMDQVIRKTVVLAGNPNVGKSTLFNALTGAHQKIANYPGVTVEKHVGQYKTTKGQLITVLDLPGTYSLNTKSEDEAIAARYILGDVEGYQKPDVVVVVAEATKLSRSLLLAKQIQQVHTQVILAVNMMDELKEFGMKLNVKLLSQELGVPVVPIIAKQENGLDDLSCIIEKQKALAANDDKVSLSEEQDIDEDYRHIDQLVARVLVSEKSSVADRSEKIDKVILHPFLGPLIFFGMMLILFQALFSWSGPMMDLIDGGFALASGWISNQVTQPWLASLLSDGVIAGVGSVVIFVPQIALTFLFIGVLEMSGYMSRGAFLIDRFMRLFGLEGRAFIPLVSSFACAIPGIMATRTMSDSRQRLVTILVAPLMTCSARLPVYTLLIACFVPATTAFGFFDWQGLTLFGLFIAGIVAAMGMSFIFSRLLPGKRNAVPFLMELPRYRLPSLSLLFKYVWLKTSSFLKSAGTIIFVLSLFLWALAYFPRPTEITEKYSQQRNAVAQSTMSQELQDEKLTEIESEESGALLRQSYMGRLGQLIEPVLSPMGYDWKLGVGVIASFAAREVFVSTMGIVFNLGEADEESQSLREKLQSSKKIDGTPAYSLATALSLLVFFAFSAQCISTLAVIKRETNSAKWAWVSFGYMTVLAYVTATITYQSASFLGL